MNKRKRKKQLMKLNKSYSNHIQLSGNNGGDILEITDCGDGTCHLFVGRSCVVEIDCIVPNEFITIALGKVVIDSGSIQDFLHTTKYDEEYINQLCSKVRK